MLNAVTLSSLDMRSLYVAVVRPIILSKQKPVEL